MITELYQLSGVVEKKASLLWLVKRPEQKLKSFSAMLGFKCDHTAFFSLSFSNWTRTGVAPGTCGTWISDGTWPASKRPPLLFIYWKWFSSQNFSACRGSRRESRTWPGEKEQQLCSHSVAHWTWVCPFLSEYVKGLDRMCVFFLFFSQRRRPAEPDYYSALPPRCWGAAASPERRGHPRAVSCGRWNTWKD